MEYINLEVGQGVLYKGPLSSLRNQYVRVLELDTINMTAKFAVPEGYYNEAKIFYVTDKEFDIRTMKIDWKSFKTLPVAKEKGE